MNDPLDSTGAGVAVIDGSVWCTCIPSLWRFQDTKSTGVTDVREKMFTGFGIRTALCGHDIHGLVQGPDRRVYWSIGDRGYRIRSSARSTFSSISPKDSRDLKLTLTPTVGKPSGGVALPKAPRFVSSYQLYARA